MIGGIYGMLGAGVGAIVIVGGAYTLGDSAGAHRVEARDAREQLAAQTASIHDRLTAEHRIGALEQQAQQQENARQGEVRDISHEITRVVDRPVYRNVCIDADGVRLIDRAQAAANAGAGAGSAGASRPSGPGAGNSPPG